VCRGIDCAGINGGSDYDNAVARVIGTNQKLDDQSLDTTTGRHLLGAAPNAIYDALKSRYRPQNRYQIPEISKDPLGEAKGPCQFDFFLKRITNSS
jgi:hypothetical protein